MNTDKERAWFEIARRNPFWVCLLVFLLLACDYGYRLANLIEQGQELDRARLMQAQNSPRLAQARQMETRLEALSLELLQIAKTNTVARQIVQDFNIQWSPGPTAPLMQQASP